MSITRLQHVQTYCISVSLVFNLGCHQISFPYTKQNYNNYPDSSTVYIIYSPEKQFRTSFRFVSEVEFY